MHPQRAAQFLSDQRRARWHDQTLWQVRLKRDSSARALPEWETLRGAAAQIKAHTLSRLADYLEQFEANAMACGAKVHFVRNASEHNRLVFDLLVERGVTRVVKSKSMLTEECGLNPFLQRRGIEVVDTDLGELIVQLRREPPSHIVMPAIHLRRREVGLTFQQHLSTPASSDPKQLTEFARQYLRNKFLQAQAGITGVNFAIAETGGIVVCTNEGNADLGVSLPNFHIACMGIEKLLPRMEHLPVFLRLLARSATGQAITSYTSHFHGPSPGGTLHIILVDNGRTRLMALKEHRRALACIRCGACMNTCPVYRRSGGHSYDAHVPGPIGSILSPARDGDRYKSLPHACSLCGSCTSVCPVKIDLHHQLLRLRQTLAESGFLAIHKRALAAVSSVFLAHPRLYSLGTRVARWLARRLPRTLLLRVTRGYSRKRELPPAIKQSFRALYRARLIKAPKSHE